MITLNNMFNKNKRRFTKVNTDELIITLYKNGIGLKKIAAITKTKVLYVNRCLERNGIKRTDYIYAERDAKVCDLYKKDKSITEIASTLSIDRHTVTSILKRSGLYKGNKHASNFSEEKLNRNQKIISLYNCGMSLSQVAKEMNISPSGVSVILKTFNIKLRPQHMKGHSKGTTKNRKHFFDIDFFDKIDTEEKAYWLGFLMADGYVSYSGTVTCALQCRDKEHLIKFLKSVKANDTEVKFNSKTKSYSVSLYSVKMAADLTKHGCKQKKSLILEFPNDVPQDLIHHFMRGYFDGDGCICIDKINRAIFSVLGTKKFLDKYESILLSYLKREKNKRTHRNAWNKNTEQIQYGGNMQVSKIYKFLYKDANIYLSRKKEKFELISSRLKTKRITEVLRV